MRSEISCLAKLLSPIIALAMLAGCAGVPVGTPHDTGSPSDTEVVQEFSARTAQELSVIVGDGANDKYLFSHYDAGEQLTWLLCGSEMICVDSKGDILNRVVLSECGTVQAYYYDADYERLLVTAIPTSSSLPASVFLDIEALHEAMKRTTLYCYSMDGNVLWSIPFDHLVWRTISKHEDWYYLIDETDDSQGVIIQVDENGELIQNIITDLNVITLVSVNSGTMLIHAYEETVPNESVDDRRLNDWLETGALFTVDEGGTYKKLATVGGWTYPFSLEMDEKECHLLFGTNVTPTGINSKPDVNDESHRSVSVYAISYSGDVRLVTDLAPILLSAQETDCFPVLNSAQRIGGYYYLFGQYQGADGAISKQFVLVLDSSFRIVEAYSFILGDYREIVSVAVEAQEIHFIVHNNEYSPSVSATVELWSIAR